MTNIVKDIEEAARTLGMHLQLVPANCPDDIATAFSTMAKERVDAFIVMPSPMLFGEHPRIVELATNNRLPGMYQAREFVDAGGLMSYGTNLERSVPAHCDVCGQDTQRGEASGVAC